MTRSINALVNTHNDLVNATATAHLLAEALTGRTVPEDERAEPDLCGVAWLLVNELRRIRDALEAATP